MCTVGHLVNIRLSLLADRDFGSAAVNILLDQGPAQDVADTVAAHGEDGLDDMERWLLTSAAIATHKPFIAYPFPTDLVNYCAAMRSLSVRPYPRDEPQCGHCSVRKECDFLSPTDGNICVRLTVSKTIEFNRDFKGFDRVKSAVEAGDLYGWMAALTDELEATMTRARQADVRRLRRRYRAPYAGTNPVP